MVWRRSFLNCGGAFRSSGRREPQESLNLKKKERFTLGDHGRAAEQGGQRPPEMFREAFLPPGPDGC